MAYASVFFVCVVFPLNNLKHSWFAGGHNKTIKTDRNLRENSFHYCAKQNNAHILRTNAFFFLAKNTTNSVCSSLGRRKVGQKCAFCFVLFARNRSFLTVCVFWSSFTTVYYWEDKSRAKASYFRQQTQKQLEYNRVFTARTAILRAHLLCYFEQLFSGCLLLLEHEKNHQELI